MRAWKKVTVRLGRMGQILEVSETGYAQLGGDAVGAWIGIPAAAAAPPRSAPARTYSQRATALRFELYGALLEPPHFGLLHPQMNWYSLFDASLHRTHLSDLIVFTGQSL